MDAFNLHGKTALVLGVANRWSIAYAIAQALQEQGVRLAVTYQNERIGAEVLKLTSDWANVLYLPCELTDDTQIDATFTQIKTAFGQLNHLIHCIAFADRAEMKKLVDPVMAAYAKEIGADTIFAQINAIK
jgi:enoyl-[acyl-carrier protein] reductase I